MATAVCCRCLIDLLRIIAVSLSLFPMRAFSASLSVNASLSHTCSPLASYRYNGNCFNHTNTHTQVMASTLVWKVIIIACLISEVMDCHLD
jgi:hypothetical protein